MNSFLTLFFFLTFWPSLDNNISYDAALYTSGSKACQCAWYKGTGHYAHSYDYMGIQIMTEYECSKGRKPFNQNARKSNGQRYYHIAKIIPTSSQKPNGKSLSACYCAWYEGTGHYAHSYDYMGIQIMTEYECSKGRKPFNQGARKSKGARYFHIAGLLLGDNEVAALRSELSSAKSEIKKLNDKTISDINTKIDNSIKTHKKEIDKKVINTLNKIPDEEVNSEVFKKIKEEIEEELKEDYMLKIQSLLDKQIELQDQINDLKPKKD